MNNKTRRNKNIDRQRLRQRQKRRRTKVSGGSDTTVKIFGEVSAIYPSVVLNKVSVQNSGGIMETLGKIDEYIAGLGLSRTLNRDVVNARRKPAHTLTIKDSQIVPPPPSTV
jgi:hypothetical protein